MDIAEKRSSAGIGELERLFLTLWPGAEIVRQLTQSEPVHVLVNDAAAEKRVAALLDRAGFENPHAPAATRIENRHEFCDEGSRLRLILVVVLRT